jgi:antitoxin component YwqK of YwqJK toxin-antitoxin module
MKNNFQNYFYFFYLILFALLLSSCSSCDEVEEVTIHYKNGTLFCNGKNKIEQKLFHINKYRIGYWNFFYPNGKISSKQLYDDEGNIKALDDFDFNGNLTKKYLANSDGELIYNYCNGILTDQVVTKFDPENEDSDVSGDHYEYYPNGKPFIIKHIINDELNGMCKSFDENGNLILEINYEDGIISNQNK